jgi:phosphate transport system substrate-binding protein
MKRKRNSSITKALSIVAVAIALALTVHGQDVNTLPQFKPGRRVTGTIRIWGNDAMSAVALRWEDGFRRYQPNVGFQTNLRGSGTAMGGLYTGAADLAFMGRPATPKEIMAFEWVFRYKPVGLEIMTGSLNVPGKSPALAVFVHKNNPISSLTLKQLDAIFSCEHRRGPASIQTWGELGLKGEWADKPIAAYTHDTETGTASFFRETVLNGSYKWSWDHVKEFKDAHRADGSVYDSAQQIADALAKDRYGIGISTVRYALPELKLVALAAHDGESYYMPTPESLIERNYPLTRVAYVYLNREPGRPLDPKLAEFLRYILSRAGQAEVLREHGFLPLSRAVVLDQLDKLK